MINKCYYIFLTLLLSCVCLVSHANNQHTDENSICNSIQPAKLNKKNGFYFVTAKSQDNPKEQQQLEDKAVISLSDIEEHYLGSDDYHVNLYIMLTHTAGKKMREATQGNIGRKMAFVLNDEILVSATIQGVLSSHFTISFDTLADAQQKHDILDCFTQKPEPMSIIEKIKQLFQQQFAY